MTHSHLMTSNKREETQQILHMSSPYDKGATGKHPPPTDQKLPPCSFCCYIACVQAAGRTWRKTSVSHSKPSWRRSPQFKIQILADPSFRNQDAMCPRTNLRRANFTSISFIICAPAVKCLLRQAVFFKKDLVLFTQSLHAGNLLFTPRLEQHSTMLCDI